MPNIMLKPGYKQTDLGVLPQEWEVRMLGALASVSSGGTPNREKADYWGGNIPWITTSQIDFITILKANEFVTDAGLQNSAAKIFKKGALLMAMYGQGKTRGRVALLGIDAATNQACAAIEVEEKIDSQYLLYNLTSRYEELRQLSNGGSQENLSGTIIKAVAIPLPPLAEQRAIADTLGAVDALLTGQRALLAKKRDLKQATQQALLTRARRLPGFTGEWQEKALGECFQKVIGGGTPSRGIAKFWGGPIPWVTVKDLTSFNAYKAQETITLEALENSASHLIPKGTLIISTRMAVGRAVIYAVDAAINQDLKALFLNVNTDTLFLYYWLQFEEENIASGATGSTVKGLQVGDLKAIVIILPPLAEQRAIAAVLRDMDTELEALTAQLAKTEALKQGLMQDLLTGTIRLTGVGHRTTV